MIIRADKRKEAVVMDRVIYNQQMYVILSDKNKFKNCLKIQQSYEKDSYRSILENLKKKQFLDDATYERIYPSGSQPSKLYGTPKVHKIKSNFKVPSFRPIVSSIDSFNYNLSRFLCDMLKTLILTDYCT